MEKIQYIYLIGLSHTGSTLISFLLNVHPAIASVGEVQLIHDLLPNRWKTKSDSCSCGKPFYECEFWNRVLAGFAARGYGLSEPDFFQFRPLTAEKPLAPHQRLFLRMSGVPRPKAVTDRALAHKKLHAFAGSTLDVTGKSVFLDTSKAVRHAPVVADNPHLASKFIDLYRDGRGVLHSWKKRLPKSRDDKLIERWLREEQERRETLAEIPSDRMIKIKYEDVCLEPVETLAGIFRFIGVDPDVDVTEGFKTEAEHHIIGNPMRLDANEKIVLDEAWRRNLSEETLSLFDEMAGEVNWKNGYASST